MKRIPGFQYYFPKDSVTWITSKIRDLLENGDFLTLGKYTEQFEKQFANYVNTKHAIAVSSGTSALEAILRSIDVRGKDVILPTNTFAATAYSVLHAGAKPIFADVGHDFSIDPGEARDKITENTAAIITVHIGGFVSANISRLREIAEDNGIDLVEDAAHAHGSMILGKKAGSLSSAAGFSFFSTKVMTTGEGGMITTNSDEIAATSRVLRDQGKSKGNWVSKVGYNWRMTEMQAIFGIAQLGLIEEIIKRRSEIARAYDEAFGRVPVVRPLLVDPASRPNYYKYIALLEKGHSPDSLREHLARSYGISLGGYVYEAPLHRQSLFEEYVRPGDRFPLAEDLCFRHICPPIYPQMIPEDAAYVSDSIRKSMAELQIA